MKKKFSRFLSWMLVVAMIAGMMPTSVFAETAEVISSDDIIGGDEEILGETGDDVDSLGTEDAIDSDAELRAAIENGGEIVLAEDIMLEATLVIPADKEIVLDLNGKTLSHAMNCTASYQMIENRGSLTIRDSENGVGKITFKDVSSGDPNFGWGSYTLYNRGTLVVESGLIENQTDLNVKGQNAVHMYCAIQQGSGSTTIKGGTISTPTYRSVRINGGTLTIEDGTFVGQVWMQPFAEGTSVAIAGGTFTNTWNDASAVFVDNSSKTVGLSVTDGIFNGKIGCSNPTALAGSVTNGTFSAAAMQGTNEALLAEGCTFEQNEDGSYTVNAGVTGLQGDGTKESPFIISSVKEFVWFQENANENMAQYDGKYIKLTADINLENISWTPIGNSGAPFKGYFDGDNHTISNLTVEGNNNHAGLFGYVKGTGMAEKTIPSVQNLILDNVNISGNYYVGGLAGQGYTCNITNVHVNGNVSGTRYVGGLVGHVYTYFKECSFKGNASCSFDALGGIAGAGDCRAYDCQVIGTISGSNWVGGIVGNGQEGTSAVGCYVEGTVSTNINYYRGVGGIAGVAGHGYSSSEFRNNYFNGEVYLCGEKVDAIIMGIVNANSNETIETTVEGNSWNTEFYSADTPVYVVADIYSANATAEEWVAGASDEKSDVRNNNLVMLESDLQYVDAKAVDDVIIMKGSEITKEQIEEIVAVNKNVAKIGNVNYETLQAALDAAAAATGEVTVEILRDINLNGVTWNPVTVSAPGYPLVTVNGNNHTITNLSDMLFAGTWAGKSGLIINDLTIADSNIVNDKNDAKETVGVGAFIGYPQASATITLNNCHLVNSTVEGGHWTGGLIGMAGGYNGNDGPVFMNLTITGCSVKDSVITGKGSVGGVIGHGSCAAWTNVVIENTEVAGNDIISTGSSNVKAGIVMGTVGAAGQPTTAAGQEKTGGAYVAVTESDNAVTSNGTAITTIYGRQGTPTGLLTITGGSYENNPLADADASWAGVKEGFKLEAGEDGKYVVTEIIVASVTDADGNVTTYSSLAKAFAAANSSTEAVTVTLLDNIELSESVPVTGTATLDLNGKTITGTDNNTSGNFYLINVKKGNLTIKDSIGEGKITLTAKTERNWSASSVVVANQQGTLTVEGGVIEHLGGTSMAYGIDNLTNGTIGDATTTITGGTVDSTYFAIRQFANSSTKLNTVVIEGGEIGYVWMQSPNDYVNTAATTVTGGSVEGICVTGKNADYTLSAKADSLGESGIYGTMPAGMALTNVNGVYTFATAVASVTDSEGAVTGYATLKDAVEAAGKGATITLLGDVTLTGGYEDADEGLRIEKGITIEGNGYTIDCGNFRKGIRIYKVSGSNMACKFNNVNIVNNMPGGRCIDTRTGKIALTLTKVTLTAEGTNSQPLTLGGDKTFYKVSLNGTEINAGKSGYGIVSFVDMDANGTLSIAGSSKITGYAALYVKGDNAKVSISNSALIGNNTYSGASNNFGAVVLEGDNNTVTMTFKAASVTANAEGDAVQGAFSILGKNNTVKLSTLAKVYANGDKALMVTGTVEGLETATVIDNGYGCFAAAGYTVTADEAGDNYVNVKPVAVIDGLAYVFLADAVKFAGKEETTIKLVTDELKISHIMVGHQFVQNITIDLNGGKLYATDKTMTSYRKGTVLTFVNGTVSGNSTGGTLVSSYGGKLVLGEGAVVTCGGQANAIKVADGQLVIDSNATVTAGAKNWLVVDNKASNVVRISDGTFTGGMSIGADVDCEISGGLFTTPIQEAWCAEYYAPVELGEEAGALKYTVGFTKEAMIDDAVYDTLAEAIEAAKDGDTIVVKKDIFVDKDDVTTLDGSYPTFFRVTGKSITVDLNGKKISGDAAGVEGMLVGMFSTEQDGHLTLVDAKNEAVVEIKANGAVVYGLIVNYDPTCTITVDGGNYFLDEAYDNLVYSGGPGVTIKDGNFRLGNVGQGPRGNGSPWIFNVLGQDDNTIVVEGGTFNADVSHQFWFTESTVVKEKALQHTDGIWTVVDAVVYVDEFRLGGPRPHHKFVGYASLEEAIASALSDETIVLLGDITLDKPVTVGADKDIVLDLNGKTLSYVTTENKGEDMITNNGILAISDSSETESGKISYAYTGTPDSSYGYGNSAIENRGTLTLLKGTVENTTAAMSHAFYAINTREGATLNIEGGKVLNLNGHAIRQVSFGTAANNVVISGGYIEGTRALQVQMPGSASAKAPEMSLTISGGELKSNESTYNLAVYVYSNGQSAEKVKVSITDGTFNGNVALNGAATKTMADAAVAVSGGTFNGAYGVYSYADESEANRVISITGGSLFTE